MPTQGISIHIGLNAVDPTKYQGWPGTLVACEQDAKDMKSIAEAQGFSATVLLTPQATAANVIAAIQAAAASLRPNDILFLTYSGHGGQVPDVGGDEDGDGLDETWVLYDRELIDDELFAMFSACQTGVRIFMLSDSCHSGTVARAMPDDDAPAGPGPRNRLMPMRVREAVYAANRKMYDALQAKYRAGDNVSLGASIQLISGCQDNQTSLDGARNGLFTEKLLKVWDQGKFKGSYRKFWRQISALMPPTQSPNLYRTGVRDVRFERQRPFTLSA